VRAGCGVTGDRRRLAH